MKEKIKKLMCIFFGHDDPVMDYTGLISTEEHYKMWKCTIRECRRCHKNIID